jgi:hypothetical protein
MGCIARAIRQYGPRAPCPGQPFMAAVCFKTECNSEMADVFGVSPFFHSFPRFLRICELRKERNTPKSILVVRPERCLLELLWTPSPDFKLLTGSFLQRHFALGNLGVTTFRRCNE